MRRLCLPLMLCAVFLSICATPAHAISWQWIADLSGPGPFWGIEHGERVWCFGGEPGVRVGVKGPCRFGTKERHKRSINFNAGYYFGLDNNLSYKAPAVAQRVDILRLGPAFEWAFLERTVEVSAGVEWDLFRGPGFDEFWRVAMPLMLDVKPFVTDRNNRDLTWANVVTLRVGALIIPSAFDGEDFGAIPGGFHTSFEVLPTVSLVFDFGHRQ